MQVCTHARTHTHTHTQSFGPWSSEKSGPIFIVWIWAKKSIICQKKNFGYSKKLIKCHLSISCQHCHFLQLLSTSLSCFTIVSFSYLLYCVIVHLNKHCCTFYLVFYLSPYTRVVSAVGHTVSLLNRGKFFYKPDSFEKCLDLDLSR